MLWFCCWMIALWNTEGGLEDPASSMRPFANLGGLWGPVARRARLAGEVPPLPMMPAMARWHNWGRDILREGDIVFRLGDARALRGIFPLSRFIAGATGSPFSHTGIVAIEDGSPVVYDCSSDGIRLMPFEVWMLDCVGPMGVKRLKPEHRRRIPGVIDYCREAFDRQVPFDFEFRLGDDAFYCLELTENAFRSQGLALSEPVRIGDWEHLTSYPVTALAMPLATRLVVRHPITLDQPVYVPGDDRQGVWASPLLETVYGPGPMGDHGAERKRRGGFNLRGDVELAVFAAAELHRSYTNLPFRFILDLTRDSRFQDFFGAGPRNPCLACPPSDGRVQLHGDGLRHPPDGARKTRTATRQVPADAAGDPTEAG